MEVYDVAIIGAGGAGLTAAIYTSRARRRTIVFEGNVTGGQIATTDVVENYPGFPDGVNGFDLARLFEEQATKFGTEMRYERVEKLEKGENGGFIVTTTEGQYGAHALIVTAGADYNKLDVPREAEFTGRGVSYCGTCDAAFFRDQDVVVVGGGNSAIDEGLFITRFARSVNVIHRRDELRASAILQERAFANEKMRFTWDTVVESIEGSDGVERVRVRNVKTGAEGTIEATGVFIFIGQTPNSHLLKGLVDMDEGGHALVDLDMRSSTPGLFVAGDLRTQAARQLVSAAGDGATAAISAEHYLSGILGSPVVAD